MIKPIKKLLKDKRYKNTNNEADKQDKENLQLVIAQNTQKAGEARLNRLRGDLDEANKNETLGLTDEQFTAFTKIMDAEIMKESLRKQVLQEIEESCKKDEKLKEQGDDKIGKMVKALAAKAKRYSAESKTSQE